MIDDEIDRRAHFVITETPSTVLNTGGPTPPSEPWPCRCCSVHLFAVVVAASALSPLLGEIGQMAVGSWHRKGRGSEYHSGRCHLVAPAPALSRICVIIVHLCSQIGPDVQTNTRHAGYLTRLKKGGPKVKMHRIR